MIKVNDQEISFTEGMTVADALSVTGDSIDTMTIVLIDRKVISKDQINSEPLLDGAHIKLMVLISGG